MRIKKAAGKLSKRSAGLLLLFFTVLAILLASMPMPAAAGATAIFKLKETDKYLLAAIKVPCSDVYGSDINLCLLSSNFMNATAFSINFIQAWVNANFYNKTEVDAKAAVLLNYTDYTASLLVNATYGEMWNFTDGGYAFTVTANDIYYNVTGLVPGELNGINFTQKTMAAGGSTLTVIRPGIYHLTAAVSLSGGNGGEYGIGISRNYINPESVADRPNCYSRFTGTGKTQNVGITCYNRLYYGDRVTLQFDDEANPAQDVDVFAANVNAIWVGN